MLYNELRTISFFKKFNFFSLLFFWYSRNMDKQKFTLLEAYVKKSIALSKLQLIETFQSADEGTNHSLDELNNIYTEVGKFIDYCDAKVGIISVNLICRKRSRKEIIFIYVFVSSFTFHSSIHMLLFERENKRNHKRKALLRYG